MERWKEGVPEVGGTVACITRDGIQWMYWNPDSKKYYPVRGWRCKIGYPPSYVKKFYELPSFEELCNQVK
jgi:hypothetical protein